MTRYSPSVRKVLTSGSNFSQPSLRTKSKSFYWEVPDYNRGSDPTLSCRFLLAATSYPFVLPSRVKCELNSVDSSIQSVNSLLTYASLAEARVDESGFVKITS